MTYQIYCPCSVERLGPATISGDFWPYFIWNWIFERDPRAKCRHCGEIVRIA